MTELNAKSRSPRRALLDLAPLELDCMNTLWPMGEGTVRDIRDRLAERRPRAYTTIMTIMDRLARKGVVERRKVGRAYFYRANLSAEEARSQALRQVLENFFGGSLESLLLQLASSFPASRPAPSAESAPRTRAAAAGASGSSAQPAAFASSSAAAASPGIPAPPAVLLAPEARQSLDADHASDAERIDDTLL